MPEISVVVPVYNTEEYLAACLDALLAQTVKDIEVIAVNNGCTDGCAEILEKYAAADHRVQVIRKPHGDIYTARNTGLRSATGDWITFCDSDDTLPSNAYEHMLKKAKKTRCDVVVGGFVELDEKSGTLPVTIPHGDGSDLKLLMYTPCVWNKLIRHEFLAACGLEFPAIPMGEDMVFLARLLRYSPHIERINRPVYYYWHHLFASTPSISHRYTLERFREHIQCHRMVYEEMRGTHYQDDAGEYVFFSLVVYLKEFLPRVWEGNEKTECFALFRDHVLAFDWTQYETRFLCIFGVPLTKFRSISAETYLAQITDLNHRKAVLEEYRAGTIGFQYILAYMRAWLGFKLKK